MSKSTVLPEIRQIVGALLYASKQPVSVDRLRRALKQTAERQGGQTADYAGVTSKQIEEAVDGLKTLLEREHTGFVIREVAGGYRLENDAACGPWIRTLLDKSRPNRLSRPALETLAIIAYRQPCTRSDVEDVRGVAVDQIVRNLLEMQLVKITGRSELPGRPWLFGTTQKFLEHFGLRSLDDLPNRQDLNAFRQAEAEAEAAAKPSADDAEGEAVPDDDDAEEEHQEELELTDLADVEDEEPKDES